MTTPAEIAVCPQCHGSGGSVWLEPDGQPNGAKCEHCDGRGQVSTPAEIAAEAARVAAEMPALLRNGQDACVDRVLFIGVDNDLHSIEFRDIWALLAERERLRGLVAERHRLNALSDGCACGWIVPGFYGDIKPLHAAHVADVLEGRAS